MRIFTFRFDSDGLLLSNAREHLGDHYLTGAVLKVLPLLCRPTPKGPSWDPEEAFNTGNTANTTPRTVSCIVIFGRKIFAEFKKKRLTLGFTQSYPLLTPIINIVF